MKAKFQLTNDINGDLIVPEIESLYYSTGKKILVNRLVEDVITAVEVDEIKGGYTLLNADSDPVFAEIESSKSVIATLKTDPDYIWIENIIESVKL